MIFNVIWTLLLYRGAQINTGYFPYDSGRVRQPVGRPTCWPRSARTTNEVLETVGILLQIGVVLGFLASSSTPSTCTSSWRRSTWSSRAGRDALGPLLPMYTGGKPDRLRGPRRRRRVRPRQDRGLHLEGPARLRHLHRVRPLPVAVPGLEHRQAAVAQAADHGPARPRATPRRRTCWPAARTPTRPRWPRCPTRPRPRRSGRWSARPRATRTGTRPTRRRHRPRRAVVLHHLRRLRRAVPGRHRARRPHRRHAPLPGADRVVVPGRARRAVQEPGEQGQPVGR